MIIESLLDTDLYKFTMQQCVLHQFPAAEVSYRFKCRTPNIDLSPFIDEINAAARRGEKSGHGKSEHADAVGNFCNDGEGLHHGGVSIVIPS